MIKVSDLTKIIDSKVIFEKITFEVNKGETLVIIGESGVGKSTLLKCIIGLIKPTYGSISLFGKDITKLSEEKLNDIRKNIGMVFQEGALFDSLTVYENVAFPLRQHTRLPEDRIRAIVRERLRFLKLEGTENLLPAQLSGGMRRRVGLARALSTEPEIILFDEPTTGLDPIIKDTLCELIIESKKEYDVTSIVVTHDMDTAFRIADKIGMLHNKKLIAIGTKEEILNSNIEIIKRFVKR